MRKIVWLLVLILCVSFVWGENYYNKDSLDLKLRMDSKIRVIPQSNSYSLNKIESKLYFYPKNGFQQEVLELKTSPETIEQDDYLFYSWIKPKETELSYWLEAKVKVFDNVQKIREKIKFPLENLPEEVVEYTEAKEIIDSDNPKIIQKASELAEGEDDLYVVVHKLATWVEENVDYDLDSITADASQKASWVLENKRGVCDEMSSLFMAMSRALGIPVKFISGVSYSNDPRFSNPWQAHGWAEVYFPNYGWVPFDATFDEYGYVDPTHIRLQESFDAGEATTKYSWTGKEVEIEVEDLDIDLNVLKTGNEKKREVDLKIFILEEEIGFGSYDLVKVEIENLKNYYVAKTLYVYSTEEVEILEGKKHALLKPGEKKTFYWVLKLAPDLDTQYTYTIPVKVKTEKNYSVEANFGSKREWAVFSELEIEQRLDGLVEEEKKILSKDISFNCAMAEEEIFLGGESKINCTVKNLGNVVLRRLEICIDQCQQVDLNINEEKKFFGLVKGEEIGEQRFLASVENEEVSKNIYLDYKVIDKAEVAIENLAVPLKADYGEKFKISFVLKKISFADAEEVKMILRHENYPNEWLIDKLTEDKKFDIDFLGSDLGFGQNNFEIIVEWKGGETKENFTVELGETSLGQKIMVFFKSINRWIGKIIK